MGIRLLEKQVVETVSYLANDTSQLIMAQDNPYRRMVLDFEVHIFGGATTAPSVPKVNDYLNLIKKISLKFGSASTQLTYSAVDKYFMDLFEYGTLPQKDALSTPTATNTTTMHFRTIIDFAQNRKVLSDFSALFNAPAKDSVTLEIEWGDISDVYGTVADGAIAAATKCNVSVLEAFEDSKVEGQTLADALTNGLDIRIGVEENPITGAHASFDDDIQEVKVLPVPSVILSQLMFAKLNITDLNPSFSDAVISQMKVQNVSSAGETIIQDYWDRLVAATKTDFGLETLPAGMLYLDWKDQRQGGLRNLDVEALKIRILTAAPAGGKNNALRILKKYIPLT